MRQIGVGIIDTGFMSEAHAIACRAAAGLFSELRRAFADLGVRDQEHHSSDIGLHGTAMLRTTQSLDAYRARPANSDSPSTGPRCDLANRTSARSIQTVTSGVSDTIAVPRLGQDQASWYRETPEFNSTAGEPRYPVVLQRASQ